jgi:hypothetical protein
MRFRFLKWLLLLGALSLQARAVTLAVQGTFAQDSDVLLQQFLVSATEQVTIETYGYAGGMIPTSPSPTAILAGGFAPNAVLFDAGGVEIASDNGGHCAITGADPQTGNCDDAWIQQILTPGNYTLALAVWDNVPVDGLLADGFTQSGNPGFTCAEFGQSGNFCDVTSALGSLRTGNYAVAFTAPNLTLPEPATFPLTLVACLLGALRLRRQFRNRSGVNS